MKQLVIAFGIFFCLSLTQSQVVERPYFRPDLTLRLVVRYPESNLISNVQSTNLYVVGNGLGLAWNNPTLLTKTGTDTWSIDLKFTADSNGYSCSDCVHNQLIPVGGRFEYRIMTSNNVDMLGANFGLLIHSISKLEAKFPTREEFSYPFFFTQIGSDYNTTVTAAFDSVIGTRSWTYYLPPSFNENPYKTYPTYLVPDLQSFYFTVQELENIFITKSIAEEVVLIGSVDYDIPNVKDGRMAFLTPIPGVQFYCNQGSWRDNCGGCVPPEVTDFKEFVIYMRDGCGYVVDSGGYGEQYLDHMVNEVLPAIQRLANNRLRLSRDYLGIGGCSLGGLISCHALWTRPNTFGMGWCKSSSFWWPTLANADNGFHFLNYTVKQTNLGPRAPQRIYLDSTDLEDEPYYAQGGAPLWVAEAMMASSPTFRMDENLWYTWVFDQDHGSWNCATRSWNALALLNPTSGAPRNPNPPVL